jgi:hypothetical protein
MNDDKDDANLDKRTQEEVNKSLLSVLLICAFFYVLYLLAGF